MELGDTRCPPSGVPTTPRPLKPAPSPRYNDLTRPRCMQEATDPQDLREHTPNGGEVQQMHQHQQQQQQRLRRELEAEIPLPTSRRSGHGSDHADSEAFFLEEQGRQHERGRQSSSSSSSDPEFPDPWQGKFDLPQNDEEIVNTAQAWVTQILLKYCEDANTEHDFEMTKLLDGRTLCRVAHTIVPGSVDTMHHDQFHNVSHLSSFMVACRKFGVPVGALFDADNPDPQRVAQCLHVLNRVVQDTVPDFVGPFLTEANPSTPSITADSSGGGAQDASDRQNELSSSSQHWPWPTTGATISSPQEEGHQQQQYRQQQQSPRHQHHEQHHPRPPSPSERPRPLSLPSRFSTASPADDTMWNSLFPSPASRPQDDFPQAIAPGGTSTLEAASVEPSLSNWLWNLNLGTFEEALANIGVQTMGDLCYVEEQDLQAIGMHGPQIRKFLQNRP